MRDLRELLASPARGTDATHEEVTAALPELGALLNLLTSRLRPDPAPAKVDAPVSGDRLLTAPEVAARLEVTTRWLRGRRLPFVVRVSARRVRYSEIGLERWLRSRNGLA